MSESTAGSWSRAEGVKRGIAATQSQLREHLFGALLEQRDCGGCTACCEFTEIVSPEYNKPAGERCGHCVDGGCAVYASRYPVCRRWQCLWKHIDALPEEARPDRCGVMCVLDQPQAPGNVLARLSVRLMVIDRKRAAAAGLLAPMIDMFEQGDLPVWLDELGDSLHLLHPPPEVARPVMDGDFSDPEARRWRAGVRETASAGQGAGEWD